MVAIIPAETIRVDPAYQEDEQFKFMAWYCADPSKQDAQAKALAKLLERHLPKDVRWRVFPSKTRLPVAYREAENKAFIPIEVICQTDRVPKFRLRKSTPKTLAALYEATFEGIVQALRSKGLKKAIDTEKATLLCWELRKLGDHKGETLARWVLSVPQKPLSFPAEQIEAVLYNIVGVKLRRNDGTHTCCTGGAVIRCIENQLRRQKTLHWNLATQLHQLTALERDPAVAHSQRMRVVINDNIAALEALDSSLTTLVNLIDQHIGRLPSNDKSWIVRQIKRFIHGRFASVAIDSERLEYEKNQARSELRAFQRISPILAAHIRLRHTEHKDELQRACDAAIAGPEQAEMVQKLAIVPGKLYNIRNQVEQLKNVRELYGRSYQKVIERVENISELVSSEYCRAGNSLFNIRGKYGRFSKKQKNPAANCAAEGSAPSEYDEKAKVKRVASLAEKSDFRHSSDSDCQSWCEKTEPAWIV